MFHSNILPGPDAGLGPCPRSAYDPMWPVVDQEATAFSGLSAQLKMVGAAGGTGGTMEPWNHATCHAMLTCQNQSWPGKMRSAPWFHHDFGDEEQTCLKMIWVWTIIGLVDLWIVNMDEYGWIWGFSPSKGTYHAKKCRCKSPFMGISWGYTYISNHQYFQKGCVCKPEKKTSLCQFSWSRLMIYQQIGDMGLGPKLVDNHSHIHLLRVGGIREYPTARPEILGKSLVGCVWYCNIQCHLLERQSLTDE